MGTIILFDMKRAGHCGRRWSPWTQAALLLGLAAGCSPSSSGWRSYTEIERGAPAPARSAPAGMPGGMGGGMGASAAAAPASGGDLAWTTPAGWKESRGGGMRLASFEMTSGGQAGLCTIIVLGGSAGGLEANIVRWIGQLGLPTPADAELQAFLARQSTVPTADGRKLLVVDLAGLQPGATDETASMLGGVLEDAGQTIFLKLTGPLGLIKAQRENFLALGRSLGNAP